MRPCVEVAPGVLVMTSRREATTSTLVLSGDRALVVDPAWDDDELTGVAAVVESSGAMCTAGFATHEHYDHVLWHPALPDVPRWSTPWSCDRLSRYRDEVLAPLHGDLSPDLIDIAGRLIPYPGAPRPAADVPLIPYPRNTRLPAPVPLPWGGREIVVHEHDAHVRGHVALEIPDAGVLIAGDMFSDVEIPLPDLDDPDLSAYVVGLDRLADVVRRSRILIPGHGTPTEDPMSRLDADRRYLDALLTGAQVSDTRITSPFLAQMHEENVKRARAKQA